MSGVPPPNKGFVTVTEMAEMCQLSRSRFYGLVAAGVLPRPARHPCSKRPLYDRGLQEKCLDIRQSGIGANGLPVLFNRKTNRRQKAQQKAQDHADLLDALKGLGLETSAPAVEDALAALFPAGHAGIDQGDVVRKVFLHLQRRQQ
jgi:hypothetical protein